MAPAAQCDPADCDKHCLEHSGTQEQLKNTRARLKNVERKVYEEFSEAANHITECAVQLVEVSKRLEEIFTRTAASLSKIDDRLDEHDEQLAALKTRAAQDDAVDQAIENRTERAIKKWGLIVSGIGLMISGLVLGLGVLKIYLASGGTFGP